MGQPASKSGTPAVFGLGVRSLGLPKMPSAKPYHARPTPTNDSTMVSLQDLPKSSGSYMDSAVMESAREFLSKRKLRSFAELTLAERPTAEPWDDSICQPLVQTAFRLDARWPRSSLAQIAEVVYGSGNHEKFNLREAFTLDLDGIWRLLVLPYDSEPAPTAGIELGADAATGFAYSYVACHGTDIDAACGIATDGFVRPSAWSGCIEGQNGSFPTTGFNCQATLGQWTEWTIKITAARALKTPRGNRACLWAQNRIASANIGNFRLAA